MPTTSRFADCPRPIALLVLAAVLSLVLLGMRAPGRRAAQTAAAPAQGDLALYAAIAADVGRGQSYYPAAVSEQRARNYPLKPFVAVRLPTLAVLAGRLGQTGAVALLAGLAGLALLSFAGMMRERLGPVGCAAATCALASCLAVDLVPGAAGFHESWAAVLIVLSLSLRTRRHWLASVLLGFAACAFRELAVGYLLVMVAAAVAEGARREAVGWLIALAGFAVLMVLHAHAVATLVLPGDPASQGWAGHGGWPFVLATTRFAPPFLALPLPLLAAVVPLCLLGWVGWRDAFALRGAMLLGGYAAAFMVVGRPDNDYWGILIAPLVLVGLVFAPRALADLAHACRPAAGRHSLVRSG